MNNCFDVASIVVTVFTAAAAIAIAYLLQKPYVRVVKMFRQGKLDRTTYKLKNAGAGTAISVVLQDRAGEAIDLDLRLDQAVRSIDALGPGAEITIKISDGREPVCVHYENLFGLLFHTELRDAANRFWMTGRKTWPYVHSLPPGVRSEMPRHWWRRG